ncbi:SGNH/GDSL hydrolase family protein [Flavobacterium sp. TAB 87]|uniref:SGNH/GDSL hydrolase family protein n=1 Tax=Flavobacterium sp. TAB 87 TaxID=1729581 RepID=UPI00076C7CB3|nr:SGNH/GDSL hydrolase family protein [Flavobacterium sp. TAB 87]KVV13678.1 GDSL-like Lipase/Acylhydrolase [Flavobacterium sp. TAB 87]
MKLRLLTLLVFSLSTLSFGCSSNDTEVTTPVQTIQPPTNLTGKTISYLALGDSYTIGQSVCEACRFPEQLKSNLSNSFIGTNFPLQIIAKTGWTTTNLLQAIQAENLENNFDLVTLLIGVNNQYQGQDFAIYQEEFPKLVSRSIALAKGVKSHVVVISIPDYAYTKQGEISQNQSKISKEIDQYNTFAKQYCEANKIAFVNITDITRNGLNEPNLVATDGLHPSQQAYSLFIDRMYPEIIKALQN